jgi:hypothetical protein
MFVIRPRLIARTMVASATSSTSNPTQPVSG